MERVIKNGNETQYYMGDMLLLTVTELGNNNFIVENRFNKLNGFCKKLGTYKTEYRLDGKYSKGKNERWYKTKKLFASSGSWFCYILQEKGFVEKTLPLY